MFARGDGLSQNKEHNKTQIWEEWHVKEYVYAALWPS